MARYLSILMVTIIRLSNANAQSTDTEIINKSDLIGTWQVNSTVTGSGLRANFRFFKDSRFIYTNDNGDYINPLISIHGIYQIEGKLLKLKVDSIEVLTGFKVVESDPGYQFGPFQMEGGEKKLYKQNGSAYVGHTYSYFKTKSQVKLIIDSAPYYRVSNNP